MIRGERKDLDEMTNAALEGDDIIPDDRPLRIILFGSQFASVDDADAYGFSASGTNAVQTLASRLLAAGYDADRPLILFRANQNIGRTTIGQAAKVNPE